MDGDDPWFWDIDRVVVELCTESESWASISYLRGKPDPAALEAALREQEIDGSTLLIEVDDAVLKNELGIKKLGQLAPVKQILRTLRKGSPRYQDWRATYGSDETLGSHTQYAAFNASNIRKRSESPRLNTTRLRLITDISPTQSHSGANDSGISVKNEAISRQSTANEHGLHDPHREAWITDATGSKRRKLDTEVDAEPSALREYDELRNHHDLQPIDEQPALEDELGQMQDDTVAPLTTADDKILTEPSVPTKKLKRIAPTLLTSEINPNRNREIPTQADMVVDNDPQNIEPGVIYMGDDGKKRVIPISQSGQDLDLPRRHQEQLRNLASADRSALQEGGKRALEAAKLLLETEKEKEIGARAEALSIGYLGKKRHSVNDVFYDSTELGKELPPMEDEDKELSFVTQGAVSDGRRLYIHGLMRRFLRSERQVIRRKGKYLSAIRPYPTKLAPMHQAPSFTLFRKNDDGEIHATREDLSKWPEVDPLASNNPADPKHDDAREAYFDLPDNLQLGGPNSYDYWNPDFLEKWRYIDGGDTVLPLYGDSDEEGEYDDETWNEIEAECGTLEKPLLPLKRAPLTSDEVDAAIDEGIAQIIVKWNKTKLPKVQRQAWSLWKKSRRDGDKRKHIRDARQHIDRINLERLPQMREKIHEEIWTSKKQILNITKIMEQSIFDREDQLWRISVWTSKAEPEKPPRRETKSKASKPTAPVYEEGEDIMTELETESFDDDDDDGFIDDDGVSAEEGERRRADDEAEDLTMSDGGTSSQSASDQPERDFETPTKATKRTKKNHMQATTELTDSDEPMTGIALAQNEDDITNSIQSSVSPSPSQLPVRLASVDNVEAKRYSPMASNEQVNASQEATQDFVDLTMLSSDISGGERSRRGSQVIDLITPEKAKNKIRLTFKRESTEPNESHFVQVSDSDDADLSPRCLILEDPAEIAKVPSAQWEKAKDRDRLLIGRLYRTNREHREDLLQLFIQLTPSVMWSAMVEVMNAFRDGKDRVRGIDAKTYKNLTGVMRYFEIYALCHYRPHRLRIHAVEVETIMGKKGLFKPFHKLCRATLESGLLPKRKETRAVDEEDSDPLSPGRRKSKASSGSSSDAEEIEGAPRKSRKRKIFENAQARDLREQDRQRLQEQEERRRRLLHKLARSGSDVNADRGRIIINDAKHDDQGFVYVHEHISKRIKDHQIDGVRFMWSQIVTNEDVMQGCLLAHTMGLGKTMQVITLLVAIAEAAKSPDKSISSQIPPSLRISKTLVLCPPSLIDNWMDELLMWAPPGILGQYRKFDSTLKSIEDRLNFIDGWYTNGGVLIMSYDMFRKLIHNSATRTFKAPLDEEEHALVRKQLLDGPNFIVADEAHKMKNAKASITQAAIQFRSRSRIALTGSPLANNIEEYHTMIEWIAPNYLGPIAEFKAKYVEPIQQGLYLESSSYERRRSLKMLGVLREDLSPKVHRADISVLRKDLKPKVEFVITVPLTDLQHKAYSIYVKSMLGTEKVTKDGQVEQTTLWHWLGVLSLLCNHPACFKAKLSERKEDAGKRGGGKRDTPRASTSEEDEPLDSASLWKVGVSEELVRQEMDLFKQFGSAIEACENSNKTRLLLQILDASKAVGDKVLIFSQSIKTLDFLEALCKKTGRDYARLDGKTKMSARQGLTKEFNTRDTELYLISTNAGGLGLNLPGANRVIIFDFRFNPVNEEQAVGRAYRIGQQKPVFVYRFVAGGTFEESIHNKAVFKMQLASRVVDKKNPIACAKKRVGDFLFEPRVVQQQDLSEFRGMDPNVLDKILDQQGDSGIRGIVMTDTFERHDHDVLTAEEQKEVMQLLSDEKLKRANKPAWEAEVRKRSIAATAKAQHLANQQKSPLAGSILTASQVAQIQGWQVNGSSSALERPVEMPPISTISPFLSNTLNSLSMPEMSPIAGVNTKIRDTTPPPDSSRSYTNPAAVPDLSVSTSGLRKAVSGHGNHISDSSYPQSSSLNHSLNAMMQGVTDNGRAGVTARQSASMVPHEPTLKTPPRASQVSNDTRPLSGDQSTSDAAVRGMPTAEQAWVTYGANKLADSSKPQPPGMDGSSDSPKSPQFPLSLRTPLANRAKNPGKESARSPQARADLSFLERVALRRQARISEVKQKNKESSLSSAQPRPAKLPSWALSEIKKANKESLRHSRPPDSKPQPSSDKQPPVIDLT